MASDTPNTRHDSLTTTDNAPTTMRAAQFNPSTNSISINTIPIPVPGPNYLLVKITCASLCHSDLMNLAPPAPGMHTSRVPVTLGHEATGHVVSLGSAASQAQTPFRQFAVGDRVGLFPPNDACHQCDGCKVHNAWCETGKVKMAGFAADGYFAEYALCDYRNAEKIPENMELESAAPLFCAGITAWNGMRKTGCKEGEWVAVVGCGGLGHLGIQYARAMRYRVMGIDISDDQLEEASACGAEHVFNSMTDKDYVAKIKQITGGGCHAAVNYTASAPAMNSTPDTLRTDGIFVVVGVPVKKIELNAIEIALGRYRIAGANNGTSGQLKEMLEFSAQHKIQPHMTYYKLEQFNEMVEVMEKEKGTKGRLAVRFN